MGFIAGAGITNIDLMYSGLPRLPSEGEELYSRNFSVQLGGGVMMTLITLHRLGIAVRAATYLGEDMFSCFARKEMAACGLFPENLYIAGKGIPLAVSTAILTKGDRTFVSYIDNQPIGDDELERVYRLCTGAKAVEMQVGYLEVYRRLKREGTILVLDVGWDDALSIEKYRPYLETADYFTPNRKEALKITGAANAEDAARRLGDYFDKVIVKLDHEGSLIYEQGELCMVPSIPEFVHVDSTGAGDAFLAGLLYGIYHDKPLRECVLMGNITGGKCVSAQGCLSAWLTGAELDSLTEKYR
jgi:sugar/nucleoside kinase (ribokinase family)